MADLSTIFGAAGFQTGSVEPQKDFDVIPPGQHVVQIEGSEVKLTKKQTGHYLELVLTVLEGPAKGRKLWDRINIENPEPQCVEIGARVLAAIGQALKIEHLVNETQLLNGVLVAHVKVKGEYNEIRTYSSLEDYRLKQQAQAVGRTARPQQATAQQGRVQAPVTAEQSTCNPSTVPAQQAVPPATASPIAAPVAQPDTTAPPVEHSGPLPWER